MMPRAIVFAGPSLAPGDRARFPTLEFRAPAACGDVYAAAAYRPRPPAIGLIDGLFETAASPWHKELLWALARGIPVIGAASLGALRAAEMRGHGMLGCGRIYRDFVAGRLTDDDEVAVEHAPAELGWRALSEPLANIRVTLARAARIGLLTTAEAHRLVAEAKATFYKERGYAALLERATGEGMSARRHGALARWLRDHAIDQKRLDALTLLRRVAAGIPSPTPRPRFVSSRYWEAFIAAQPQAPGRTARD